jgi:hypothetical protein
MLRAVETSRGSLPLHCCVREFARTIAGFTEPHRMAGDSASLPIEGYQVPPFSSAVGCPSIRAKALSRTENPWRCVSIAIPVQTLDDQNNCLHLLHLYLNHPLVERVWFCCCFCLYRSTSHRFGPNFGHDSSIRTPKLELGARAPNQSFGTAVQPARGTRELLSMRTISGYGVWVRSIQ